MLRVVVVSTINPYPIDRGDKNRLAHVIELLRRVAQVRLVFLDRNWEERQGNVYEAVDARAVPVARAGVMLRGALAAATGQPFLALRFGTNDAMRRVEREIKEFEPDVLWAFQITTYPFLKMASKRSVFDLVDSTSRYVSDATHAHQLNGMSRVAAMSNWRISRYERDAIKTAGTVLVNSEQDRQWLNALHGAVTNIEVLPNCVPASMLTKAWSWQAERPPRLLFVANFAYPPHRDSLVRFGRAVFPLVRRQLPAAELVVVGRGADSVLQQLHGVAGIRSMGFVDDLVDVYRNSSALVAPQSVVTGLQYKMIEAMAVGLPVICSPEVLAASPMRAGTHLLVAEGPTDFLQRLVELIGDRALAETVSTAAKQYIFEHHVWDRYLDLVTRVLVA